MIAIASGALASGVLLAGCATTEPLENRLARDGWTQEPIIEGAESVIGAISPKECETFFNLLQAEGARGLRTFGYVHVSGAYLLVKDWETDDGRDFADELEAAGSDCREMTMAYDSAVLRWSVSPLEGMGEQSAYHLVAEDDGGDLVADMFVAGGSIGDEAWLVRVLSGPEGAGSVEEEAMVAVLSAKT